MKQNILKVGTVMGLLLLIGVFTSCNDTKKENKNQELGNIAKLDEVIEKAKQLEEALWVVNGLIEELTEENTVEIAIDIIRN